MSDAAIALITAIIITVLAISYFFIGWHTRRSLRFPVRAASVILLIFGCYFAGWLTLVIQGLRYLYEWITATPMTTLLASGLIMIGLGFICWVIADFIAVPSKEEAKIARTARLAKRVEKDRQALNQNQPDIDQLKPESVNPAAPQETLIIDRDQN